MRWKEGRDALEARTVSSSTAGMVASFVETAGKAGAKLVLVDPEQL
ncbi:hypothetical protein [Mesorhizobium amorphae]